MIESVEAVIGEALRRLGAEIQADLPSGLAALVILLGGLLGAKLARWLTARVLRSVDLDGRVRRSGLAAAIHCPARGASRIVCQAVYWTVLAIGAIVALNALGPKAAQHLVSDAFALAPRLAAAVLIVIGGMWLGLYLSRSALIWAVNENLPAPRKLALGVRTLTIFAAVAVAADALNLAGGLFRSIFTVVLGGVVLAASLAIGLGSRDVVRRYFEERSASEHLQRDETAEEEKIWNHL